MTDVPTSPVVKAAFEEIEIWVTIPRAFISSAISLPVHWLMGRPAFAGASQASVAIWQRCKERKSWGDSWARGILEPFAHAQRLQINPLPSCPAVSPQAHRIDVDMQIASNLRIRRSLSSS